MSFADRFVDNIVINDSKLSPIFGYEDELIVSLEQSLEPIQPFIHSLVDYIKTAKDRCYYPNEHGLSHDQSASIYLYSMECGVNSFYRIFNAALRTEDRNTVKHWFSFLKLFHSALDLLPHLKTRNVWRGVREPLTEQYYKGDKIIWWSVTSCSLDVHVIKHFLGTNGTIFLIEALNAIDITGYTRYTNECEVILPPGVHLQVVANCLDHSGGLRLLHLWQISPSSDKLESKEEHSNQSKSKSRSHRTSSRKFSIITAIIFTLIGIVIGVIVVFVTRKKNSLGTNLSLTNPMLTMNETETSNTTLSATTVRTTYFRRTTDEIQDKQLFGTQTSQIDVQPNIDLLQDLGVQIFRILVSWYQLEEHAKNNISSSYIKKLDNFISSLEQGNIRILICLFETPCWASSGTCDLRKYRPKDYNDYADAMTYLLERYQDRIYAWEIWNEPNLSENWLRPECQSYNGSCFRPPNLNDEHLTFIDLIGAQEYSTMVKITYDKMKSIDSHVTILAGSLLGSDLDYLNEMYKSGIKDVMDGLSIHPYISAYTKPTLQDAEIYGPDECPLDQISLKFWCFKHGIEEIREKMILQTDSLKSIWITEFGFSSSDFERKIGIPRQTNYLERALDIIQQTWSFVHVACYFEFNDQRNTAIRKGLFGLFDRNLTIKTSGQMFTRKVKYKSLSYSITTLNISQTTISSPLDVYPRGNIDTYTPYFSWPRFQNITYYYLRVDDHGIPKIEGRIIEILTPFEANCSRNDQQFCRFLSSIQFTESGGEWWIKTSFEKNSTSLVHEVFTIE